MRHDSLLDLLWGLCIGNARPGAALLTLIAKVALICEDHTVLPASAGPSTFRRSEPMIALNAITMCSSTPKLAPELRDGTDLGTQGLAQTRRVCFLNDAMSCQQRA